MIEINGQPFEPKSVEENVTDIVNTINDYATVNNIVNSKGEQMFIEKNIANPLYTILYGVGYLATQLQSLVYSAAAAFSIADSSDRQLVDLAQLAGMRLRGATPSLLPVVVTASVDNPVTLQGEYQLGSDVPATDYNTITVDTPQGTAVFKVVYTSTIPKGESRLILLVSEENKAYTVPKNTITAFDQEIENIEALTQNASITGNQAETVAQLRERLQNRSEITTSIDLCADAISQLPGVARCSISLNDDQTTPIDVGSISVPPRQALVMVQGYNPKIAETFYSYLMCKTVELLSGDRQTIPINYAAKSGQVLTVNILPPELVTVQVTVYVSAAVSEGNEVILSDEFIDAAKLTVSSLTEVMEIGKALYASEVLSILEKTYPEYIFQGAEVNLEGKPASYVARPKADQLIDFALDSINIQGVAL